MLGDFRDVKIEKITPMYEEKLNKSRLIRQVNILKQGRHLQNIMILQSHSTEDKYVLIAGNPEYQAYKKQGVKMVFCYIQKPRDLVEQLYTLLERMFEQPTKWINRHNVITNLMNLGQKVDQIAKRVGVDKSYIKRYLLDSDVTDEINQMAIANEAVNTVKDVKKLKLDPKLENRLLKMAVYFPKGHPTRLTHDKIVKIKLMINHTNFKNLSLDHQGNMLQLAMNYKTELIISWRTIADELLDEQTPKFPDEYDEFNLTQ
jgi:hypothetical protein